MRTTDLKWHPKKHKSLEFMVEALVLASKVKPVCKPLSQALLRCFRSAAFQST